MCSWEDARPDQTGAVAEVPRKGPRTSSGGSHRADPDPCGSALVRGFGENGAAVVRDVVLVGPQMISSCPPRVAFLVPVQAYGIRPRAERFRTERDHGRNVGWGQSPRLRRSARL